MLKRAFDIVLSAALLVAALPWLALIAAAIKLDDGGPVFYRGQRMGRHGRPFRIFKIRSMVVGAEGMGGSSSAEEDPRITPLGAFLRRYKLDELPQLVNVLAGQMSFVGPRPEVRRFVEMYTDEQKAILTVRPGITDWASLQFHNENEIISRSGITDADEAYLRLVRPEKLRLQLRYVRDHGFRTDLKILGATLATLVSSRIQCFGRLQEKM